MSSTAPPSSRSAKVRKSARTGTFEYQPFEIRSLGGGLDHKVRRDLTDPGRWWDGQGMYPRLLQAQKAQGLEAFIQDRLSPPFVGEFSRGSIFYLKGTDAYWHSGGINPDTDLVLNFGAPLTHDNWEFKLEGDPESSWTRIDVITPIGGAPPFTYLIAFSAAPYPVVQFGVQDEYDIANAPTRRRPMFRNMYGRLGSVTPGASLDTCPVNLISSLYKSPDDEALILGTPRMVYQYDKINKTANYTDHINPVYVTGTITSIGVGAVGITSLVTGAATAWNGVAWPLPVAPKWLFKLDEDPDTYWTEVDSLTDATHIELAYNYPKALAVPGKAYTLIRVWQAAASPDAARIFPWSVAQWGYQVPGKRLILTNGSDPVLEYDAGSGRITALPFWLDTAHTVPWAPAPDWARFTMEFKEHLILGYYKLNAVVYERGIMWSDALDCITWRQAFFRLLPGAGEMTGMGQLGDLLIVFLDRAVYSLRYLGAPFYFGIAQRIADVGCIAAGSICNIRDQQVVFLGEDDIYTYDGVRAVPIGAPVRDMIYPLLNDRNKPLVASFYDEPSGRYFLSVPTTEYDDRNVYTFVYDVNEQKWSKPLMGFTAIGKHFVTDDTGMVDADARIVDSVTDLVDGRFTTKTPVLLAGDHGGSVYLLDQGTNIDGSSQLARIEFPITDLGVPGVKRLGWVEFDMSKHKSNARLYVGMSTDGEELTWKGPITITKENPSGDPWVQRKPRTWVNESARYFSFIVEHDAPDEDLWVNAMTLWFRWRGQR